MAYSYGAPLTPAESRYRQLAEAMMARGLNPGITMGGIGGISQGLGALAQAFAGHRLGQRADKERQMATENAMSQIEALQLDPQKAAIVKAITGMDPMAGMSTAASLMSQQPGETWTPMSNEQEAAAGLDTSGAYLQSTTGDIKAINDPRKPGSTKFTGPGNISFEVGGYDLAPGETNLWNPQTNRPMTVDEMGGGGTGGGITTEPLAPAGGQQSQPAPAAYEPTIQKAAAEFGIPVDLFREHLRIESDNFSPDVIAGQRLSPAGAIGIGQFMPDTAADEGIDPTDPQEAIYAAARYLRQQHDKFGKSWQNAIAAYNWGPGNLQSQGILKAPGETRKHLSKLAPWLGGGQPQQPVRMAAGDDFWSQYAAPKDSAKAPEHWRYDAEGNLEPIPGGKADPKYFETVRKVEADWRQTLQRPIQQAMESTKQISRIRSALARQDGTGDIAAITAFNKMLDEGAVVREADVTLTLEAQSFADRLQTWIANKQEGEILAPELRRKLSELSEEIYRVTGEVTRSAVMPYAGVIASEGGKFENVVPHALQQQLGWIAPPPQGRRALGANPARAKQLEEMYLGPGAK